MDSGITVPFANDVEGRSGCVWERLYTKRAPAPIALEALQRFLVKLQAEIAGLQIGLRELCRSIGRHDYFNKSWI